MAAEVTIRPLQARDLSEVGQLFAAHTGRPADLATFGTWIDGCPSMGARTSGGLVGYAVCRGFAPDVVELAALLVDPGSRGRGVGTDLVAQVERGALEAGFAAVVTVASSGYAVRGAKRSSRPFHEGRGYRTLLETPSTAVLARTRVSADRRSKVLVTPTDGARPGPRGATGAGRGRFDRREPGRDDRW